MVIIVICLYSILNEESVTHSIVRNVIFDSELVHTVSSYSSIVGVVNCVTNYIRLVNISNHMEMNWVASELKCLTDILHFDVADVTYT